jgi:signal transduction histidine kinase
MQVHFLNIWKEGKGVGKDSFKFRLVAYMSAIILMVVYHIENHLPFGVLETISVIVFFIAPHVFLYRYIRSNSTLSHVIRDSVYDFFFAGWFIGIMNVSIVPSIVFGMGSITNYLAMRGHKKLYRILLIPIGCLPVLIIEDFQFHFETSNLLLYLSLAYSVMHYLINSYILYYSGSMVRLQNIEINLQRKEIETQSETLKKLNESLQTANSGLEIKVQNRTRELEVKNKKLEEYTFMNAHKLRAPIATILGLIHLLDLKDVSKQEQILEGLRKTALELDVAIRGIRAKLEEEDWNIERYDKK